MPEEPLPDWRTQAADWFSHEDEVVARLRKHYPVDRELLHDAFVKALLQVCQDGKYDPARGGPVPFLVEASRRVLRDLVGSDTSRRHREEKKGKADVARQSLAARNPLDQLVDTELAQIARAEAARTPEEQRFLELWEQGIDDLERLAEAIGCRGLPREQREKQVKNFRDRLMKRLRRMKDCLGEEGADP
jgi:hypothetical protein